MTEPGGPGRDEPQPKEVLLWGPRLGTSSREGGRSV